MVSHNLQYTSLNTQNEDGQSQQRTVFTIIALLYVNECFPADIKLYNMCNSHQFYDKAKMDIDGVITFLKLLQPQLEQHPQELR